VQYLDAAVRAGDWLANTQESDGTWSRYNFQGHAATYNAEVDWALVRLSQVVGESRYAEAARRHLDWICAQQSTDGWFRNAGFRSDDVPTTHTIAYTLRGLLE